MTFIKGASWLMAALVGTSLNLAPFPIAPILADDSQHTFQFINPVDIILTELATCESNNNPNAVGDGGLARGILQFHKATFIGFSKKYNLYPLAEDKEIEVFYLDSAEQIKLAKLILSKEKEGWRHWYTCSRKIGLDTFR